MKPRKNGKVFFWVVEKKHTHVLVQVPRDYYWLSCRTTVSKRAKGETWNMETNKYIENIRVTERLWNRNVIHLFSTLWPLKIFFYMACDCAFLQRDLAIMHDGDGKSMPVLRCYLGVESPRHCKQDLRLLESPESWFLNITQDLSILLFLFASDRSLGGFFVKRLGLRSSILSWRALSWNINKQKLFFSLFSLLTAN